MYDRMTYCEIGLCLEFANRYEEVKIPAYKSKLSFHDWISKGQDIKGLRDIARKIKGT